MACKFCPKIRKTDWIFILIAALGFYFINKLGYAPKFNTPNSKLSYPLLHPIEKPNNMTEEERKKTEAEHQKRLSELERWRKLTTERELKMVELKKEITTLKEEIKRLKGE